MIKKSIVISKFILALSTFVFGILSYKSSYKIAFVFFLITISCGSGIARFGIHDPSRFVYRLHRNLSNASFLFVPAFWASSYAYELHKFVSLAFLFIPFIMSFFSSNMSPSNIENSMTFFALLSILSIIYACYVKTILTGFLGIVLLILSIVSLQSGLVIGPLKGIDFFHYLMIPASYCLAKGVIPI